MAIPRDSLTRLFGHHSTKTKAKLKKSSEKILSGQDVPAISYKSENIIDGKHVSNKEMAEYRKWLKQSDAWFKMMGSKVEGGR